MNSSNQIKINIFFFLKRIPPNTKAAVTLGKGLTKDRLVQACMRMRLLGHGHSVVFYASKEVDTMIRSSSKPQLPKCKDVLEWSINNSLCQAMNDLFYWAMQGLTFTKKHCINLEIMFNLFERPIENNQIQQKYFHNCVENSKISLELMFGKSRVKRLLKDIIEEKVRRLIKKMKFSNQQFELKSAKIIKQIVEKIPQFEKFSQIMLEEENEMEVEIDKEQEYEEYRPPVAVPYLNHLDKDVEIFVKQGVFTKSSIFRSLAQSLSNSSLAEFVEENKSWSLNLYVTRDFTETVKETTTKIDDYLAMPRWLAIQNDVAVILSGFEVNELMHDFIENESCQLVMLMPRMRSGQRRVLQYSMLFWKNKKKFSGLPEPLLQELGIFVGSLYFNTNEEQECYMRLIGFVTWNWRRSNYQHCDRIEQNGFVLPQNRNIVFKGDKRRILEIIFKTDPSKFIQNLAYIRNYRVVPNSAHHLFLLRGQYVNLEKR